MDKSKLKACAVRQAEAAAQILWGTETLFGLFGSHLGDLFSGKTSLRIKVWTMFLFIYLIICQIPQKRSNLITFWSTISESVDPFTGLEVKLSQPLELNLVLHHLKRIFRCLNESHYILHNIYKIKVAHSLKECISPAVFHSRVWAKMYELFGKFLKTKVV